MRAAVLKMKDPRQIIRDMEKLDEMGEGTECLDTTVEMALVQVKMCLWLSVSLMFYIYATAKLDKVLMFERA